MRKKHEESVEESIEEYNNQALAQLTSDKYSHAMAYLNQALFKVRLMPDSLKKNSLAALTYNNLGCFYKRLGQIEQALEYFFQSLDLELNGASSAESLANTHLNISVLLSLKSEHERALKYAIKALMILKKDYRNNPQLIVSIINSYQRIGIEYKFLSHFSQALQCFRKGYEICFKTMSSVTVGLRKNFKKMYIDTLAEMGSDKKNEKSQRPLRTQAFKKRPTSPRSSSLDSNTTIWTSSISGNAKTPKNTDRYSGNHNRRESVALPPMESFNVGKKKCLGSIHEIEELKKKRLNSNKHRAQERLAATVIQACWKGYVQRKKYSQMLVAKKIREAEDVARKAIDEIKTLKNISKNPREIFKVLKKN